MRFLFPSMLAWTSYCGVSSFHRNTGANKTWCINAVQTPAWVLIANVLVAKPTFKMGKFFTTFTTCHSGSWRKGWGLQQKSIYLVPDTFNLSSHLSLKTTLKGSYCHHSHFTVENSGDHRVCIMSKFRGRIPPRHTSLQSPTCSKKVNLSEMRLECPKKV